MFEKEAREYGNSFEWTNDDRIIDYSEQGFQKGAEFGYNKAFVEADKNLKAVVADFNKANKEIKLLKETHRQSIGILVEQIEELHKANEWHKADVPTNPINKVVLGYIKDYNSKKFCLVKWNGEWWYDARTWNDKVKLIAWKEIVLPELKEIE